MARIAVETVGYGAVHGMLDDRVSGDVDIGGSGDRGLAASSGTLDILCCGIA